MLAAVAVLASPLFLRSANLFQPVVLDQAAWTAALFAVTRLSWQRDARWWLALGVALGVGLLVKFSIAFIGIGIVLAILLTPLRASLLKTIWPWLALIIALAIGSPSLVGQYELGFPVMQQMEDLRKVQLERVTPAAFLLGQLYWGPGTLLAVIGAGRPPRRQAALALPRHSAGAAWEPSPCCCCSRESPTTWARSIPRCSARAPWCWSGAGSAGRSA